MDLEREYSEELAYTHRMVTLPFFCRPISGLAC